MKLLVSPTDVSEARECVKAGVEIVDCKNPREGSLGANFPWVIREIRELVDRARFSSELSATIGDVPNLPGTVALAAFGCASCGVDYVKVGLMGPETVEQAVHLLEAVVKAVKGPFPAVKVVAAGYADRDRLGGKSIPPSSVPEVAHAAGADVAMLDTAVKDGKSILQFQTVKSLQKFVQEARDLGLESALAGSIHEEEVPVIMDIGPGILGVRSIVCENFDRVEGRITAELIEVLQETLQK
ncbi:MAG: (5-formylfuran-3-yl)methyl phosphate synthase [Promethearchaeota archaeon]